MTCDNTTAPMLLVIDVIDRLFAHSLTEASGEIHGYDNDDECVDGQIVCDVAVDIDNDADVVNVDDAAKFRDECDKQDASDSLSDFPASDERSVAAAALIAEQQDDKSLDICKSLANRCKAGYFLITAFYIVTNVYWCKIMNSCTCLKPDVYRQ